MAVLESLMARVAATPEFAVTGGLVTGTHAVRGVLPYLDTEGQELALRFLFQAIVAHSIASDDEHVVKLAYRAREEGRVHGDDATYRWCAAREAGLI